MAPIRHITVLGSFNRTSVGDKAILIALLDLLYSQRTSPLRVRVLATDPNAIREELEDYPWRDRVDVVALEREDAAGGDPQGSVDGDSAAAAAGGARPDGGPDGGGGWTARLRTVIPTGALSLLASLRFLYRSRGGFHEGSDALLIGGGNLLMDLYGGWPIRPYAVARSFTRAGKPVVLAGVGAFPLRTWWGEALLRRTCRWALSCGVRDHATREYLREEWGVEAEWQPDLALSLPFAPPSDPVDDRRRICVNVAPYLVGGANDVAAQRELIGRLARQLSDQAVQWGDRTEFVLVDTNYPTDRDASLYLARALADAGIPPGRVQHVDRLLGTREVLDLFASSELAVVMRLHAGLLALRVGIPVVALGYQPKVDAVFSSLQLERAVLRMDQVDALGSRLQEVERSPEDFSLGDRREQLDRLNRDWARGLFATLDSGSRR